MKRRAALLAILLLLPIRTAAAEPPGDGQYSIEVTLAGGSGRASVESPTEITIVGNEATAVVTWSSPYYEHMLVDGAYYYPVRAESGSTFEIPVSLDREMAVSAQTVAMSTPHQIDYVLFFDSATLKPVGEEPGGAPYAGVALASVALVALAAGVSLYIKRKRKQR